MLMKQDSTTINSPAVLSVPTACGNCGVEERRLLHHVRHRGIFRRLCTTCVLRLHPQSFCPTCFQVYPPTPLNDAVLTCCKCYSSSHSHCVESGPTSSSSTPYTCPLCLNPNAPIFKLRLAKEANVEIGDVRREGCRVLDRDDAKKLLAAAKIASASMTKAAVAARAEAERRAKEAAFTRKRAKEALEHVAYLVMKEKSRKKELVLAGPGLGGIVNNGGYTDAHAHVKMEKENDVNVSTSNGNGSVTVVEEKMNDSGNVDGDNSNQVLVALNAVELRENEKIGSGTTEHGEGSGVYQTDDDHALAVMDVDETGRMRLSAGETNNDSGTDMETGAANRITQGEKLEDVNNVVVLVQPMAQHAENCNGGEQHTNGGSL